MPFFTMTVLKVHVLVPGPATPGAMLPSIEEAPTIFALLTVWLKLAEFSADAATPGQAASVVV